jgi:hypothetical protein
MSFAAPRPPRPSLSLVRGPPVFRLRLRRGADLALGVRLAFCSLCWCCRMRGHAPRAFGAAPQVWWASWRGFGRRGSRGCPRETHRRSRSAPAQNTNVREATRSPHSGGQRRRRGGLVTPSARPSTSHPVGHQPPTRRQVCPPPETAGRDTGGPRRPKGGRGGCEDEFCDARGAR